MIITCPSCATRYEIPAENLGAAGRMVRCTNCGHRWFVANDTIEFDEDDLDQDDSASFEDTDAVVDEAVEEVQAPLSQAPDLEQGFQSKEEDKEPEPRRSTAATVGWLAVLLILLLLTGLVLGRNELVALAPQTAPIYQRMGLPVTQTIGLELTGIVSERLSGQDGDRLRITGMVQNVAGAERVVPQLRVALLDTERNEVLVQEVEVPVGTLADGANSRFSIDIEDPPVDARNFSVTFAVPE